MCQEHLQRIETIESELLRRINSTEAEVDYTEVMEVEADQETTGSHQLLVLCSLNNIIEEQAAEGYEHKPWTYIYIFY